MKINKGFSAWNRPYLFQALEAKMAMFTPEQKKHVVSLAIGDPDIPTPAPIRNAIIREHKNAYHGYPTAQGRLDLREALTDYYQRRFGTVISSDSIFIGPGAKTDLFDLNAVFSNPGDQVMILDPAYPVYRDAAEYRNNRIVYLKGSLDNHYQPPLPSNDEIDNLALIYLCYPNNPTGADASIDYVSGIIDFARNHDALVIMDIAYADFIPGNKSSSAFSVFELPGSEDVCIEVGSFSKPFSMTGDRLSWITIKDKQIAEFWHRYRSNRDSGASNYDQAGGLAALTNPEVTEIVQQNFRIYGKRAEILKQGLNELGFPWSGLQNTPYAWFKTPISDDIEAAARILEDAGVLLTPGSGFGPGGEGFLRATIFQPEMQLEKAINRLLKLKF